METQQEAQAQPVVQEGGQQQQQPTVTMAQGSVQVAIKPDSTEASQPQGETQQELPTSHEQQQDVQQMMQDQQQAEADIKADLTSKGVDFGALESEYERDGELSADSLKKLEAAGYPKSVVDAYLNGLDAKVERFATTVKQMAGGPDDYARLGQYVQSQGEAVRKAFNAAIQSGDLGQIQLAINGLKAQMVQAYGTQGPTIMGGGMAAATPQGYASTAEMVRDMSDPKYQTDNAYRAVVAQKIANSSIF